MVLGVEGCTRLVAWTALVLYEVYIISASKRRAYDAEVGGLRMAAYQLPSWVFGWVWLTLKSLIVASMFFWQEYATDVTDYTFPTVFALVFALVVLSKFWPVLFFEHCWYGGALCLSLLLSGISIAAMVLMIVTSNEGNLWALPFALFVPVVAWYFFATLLTLEWARLKCGWYTGGCADGMENGVSIVYIVPDEGKEADASFKHHGHHPPGKHNYAHPHSLHHLKDDEKRGKHKK